MLGLNNLKSKYKPLSYLLLALVTLLTQVMYQYKVTGAPLAQRKVTVLSPIASATTTHTIDFGIATAGVLGSIQLEYCDNNPFVGTPCTAPPGLDLTGANLSSQTGEIGFTIDPSSTANNVLLTRAPSASAAGPVQYVLDSVINPSTPNNSTYVRMSTYATADGTGPLTDQGGAVFATAGSYGTAAFVPPFLVFCVGVTINTNCTSISGDSVNFGTLTPSQVHSVTTQSSAATNDPTGYVIYSLGTTLTSGNNTIAAMGTQNPSIAGLAQFGINLRDNNNPNNGLDITGAGTGAAMPNYNIPDLYMFSPGAAIAQSTLPTDYNVYTTSYIANIPIGQAPGIYVTTITYMAVAQF